IPWLMDPVFFRNRSFGSAVSPIFPIITRILFFEQRHYPVWWFFAAWRLDLLGKDRSPRGFGYRPYYLRGLRFDLYGFSFTIRLANLPAHPNEFTKIRRLTPKHGGEKGHRDRHE